MVLTSQVVENDATATLQGKKELEKLMGDLLWYIHEVPR